MTAFIVLPVGDDDALTARRGVLERRQDRADLGRGRRVVTSIMPTESPMQQQKVCAVSIGMTTNALS
jgi:hypothetical protein